MSDGDKKALVLVLRALINARKQTTVLDLIGDYKETEGRNIPFQQYGARNLEDFLNNCGEFRVDSYKVIHVKCNENSMHINKLVSEQNAKKKRRSAGRIMPQRRMNMYHAPTRPLQSVYSTAYQNMKSRSPMKYPSIQNRSQKPTYSHISNNDNNHKNQYAKGLSRSTPPPRDNKPSFVVTFDSGTPIIVTKQEFARQQSVESNSSNKRAITKSSENLANRLNQYQNGKPQISVQSNGITITNTTANDLRNTLNQKKVEQITRTIVQPQQKQEPANQQDNDLRNKLNQKRNETEKVSPQQQQQHQQQPQQYSQPPQHYQHQPQHYQQQQQPHHYQQQPPQNYQQLPPKNYQQQPLQNYQQHLHNIQSILRSNQQRTIINDRQVQQQTVEVQIPAKSSKLHDRLKSQQYPVQPVVQQSTPQQIQEPEPVLAPRVADDGSTSKLNSRLTRKHSSVSEKSNSSTTSSLSNGSSSPPPTTTSEVSYF